MNIITVVGARPQFIKAATISRIIKLDSDINEIIIHTGQHYDNGLSEIFFTELEIPKPDYNLGIGSAMHGVQTGRMMEAIEEILIKTKPDCLLLQPCQR